MISRDAFNSDPPESEGDSTFLDSRWTQPADNNVGKASPRPVCVDAHYLLSLAPDKENRRNCRLFEQHQAIVCSHCCTVADVNL